MSRVYIDKDRFYNKIKLESYALHDTSLADNVLMIIDWVIGKTPGITEDDVVEIIKKSYSNMEIPEETLRELTELFDRGYGNHVFEN